MLRYCSSIGMGRSAASPCSTCYSRQGVPPPPRKAPGLGMGRPRLSVPTGHPITDCDDHAQALGAHDAAPR
jgi:hypothetical protein